MVQCRKRWAITLDESLSETEKRRHRQQVRSHLEKMFPEGVKDLQETCFHIEYPPIIPGKVGFRLLSPKEKGGFSYFFEMLSTWIIPGGIEMDQVSSVDFSLPSDRSQIFTLSHIVVPVKHKEQIDQIIRTYPILEKELKCGYSSPYYKGQALKKRGVLFQQKRGVVSDYLHRLIKKLKGKPKALQEMEELLAHSSDSYIAERREESIGKTIGRCIWLKGKVNRENPVRLKFLKAPIVHQGEVMTALSIAVGVYFNDEMEWLDPESAVSAVKKYVPDACEVEGSFIHLSRSKEAGAALSMEFSKEGGESFSDEELDVLRTALPFELQERVETYLGATTVPREEEGIYEDVFHLVDQIQQGKASIAVSVQLEEQTPARFLYRVVVVRGQNEDTQEMDNLFANSQTFLEYLPDWERGVGGAEEPTMLASSFRLGISKKLFLRDDHSCDLSKARQVVSQELERILSGRGSCKQEGLDDQKELLELLRAALAEEGVGDSSLLEKFFYSLTPTQFRSKGDVEQLKELFFLLYDVIQEGDILDGDPYLVEEERDVDSLYLLVTAKNVRLLDDLHQHIEEQYPSQDKIISARINTNDQGYLVYLYFSSDPYSQDLFCQTICRYLDQLTAF